MRPGRPHISRAQGGCVAVPDFGSAHVPMSTYPAPQAIGIDRIELARILSNRLTFMSDQTASVVWATDGITRTADHDRLIVHRP